MIGLLIGIVAYFISGANVFGEDLIFALDVVENWYYIVLGFLSLTALVLLTVFVATGAAMATMIGSQRFQRFLAGQTRVQRGISAISSEASERLATGSAAVSGQIQAGGIEETTPSEYRAIANSKNNNAKALAFKRVLELGQEQRLKRINRDAYTKLKSAYEAVYSQ